MLLDKREKSVQRIKEVINLVIKKYSYVNYGNVIQPAKFQNEEICFEQLLIHLFLDETKIFKSRIRLVYHFYLHLDLFYAI